MTTATLPDVLFASLPVEDPPSDGLSLNSLPGDAFALPPRAFVDTFADALGLGADDLTRSDRESLTRAIQHGTSRIKIIDALGRHRAEPTPAIRVPESHGVRREPDGFALSEIFTRFAPDDDAAFLRYTFAKICDREPREGERLAFEFDLRRGLVDRATVVKRIVATASSEGRVALLDTLKTPGSKPEDESEGEPDPHAARHMPAGLVYDEGGRETLIFVREVPRTGFVTAPDVLRQAPKSVHGGWAVSEGWLIVGPKRTFAPGPWRVDLDIVQAPEAVVDIDVVANSGLDVLQALAICGSFCGGFRIEVRPEHRFAELRLAVRATGVAHPWIRPRNISMQRLA